MHTLLALAILLAMAGCQDMRNSGACPVAPPLPAEIMPKAPVAERAQTWQPGYVDWDGRNYAFIAGRWIIRDGADTPWMPGHWDRPEVTGACVWVPAHWL